MNAFTQKHSKIVQSNRRIKILVISDGKVMDLAQRKYLESRFIVKFIDNLQTVAEHIKQTKNTYEVVVFNVYQDSLLLNSLIKDCCGKSPLLAIPVIIIDHHGDEKLNMKLLAAGAGYCISEQEGVDSLCLLITTMATRQQRTISFRRSFLWQQAAFKLIDTCRFHINRIEEVEPLTLLLCNCYPIPNKAYAGIRELLMNAIEHGLLDIGFELKKRLIESGKWLDEIKSRQSLAENMSKQVEVIFQKKDDEYYLKISDNGNGFEWSKYLAVDSSRAVQANGRGIAKAAASSFDHIQYNKIGNTVMALVYVREQDDDAFPW